MTKLLSILFITGIIITGCTITPQNNTASKPLINNPPGREEASQAIPSIMKLTSPAFENNAQIPAKYTCDGDNISPPLVISEVSERAKSLVLIVDDPDVAGGSWTHWTVWNIPTGTTAIPEGGPLPANAVEGTTDFGMIGWGGPCPPTGTHRYVFTLYAVGTDLYLDSSAKKKEIMAAIEDMVIEKAELTGLYQRP